METKPSSQKPVNLHVLSEQKSGSGSVIQNMENLGPSPKQPQTTFKIQNDVRIYIYKFKIISVCMLNGLHGLMFNVYPS